MRGAITNGHTGTMVNAETAATGVRRMPLHGTRAMIDQVDDALVLLLALRRRLAQVAAACKRHAGLPARDPEREAQVRGRAGGLARRVALPAPTTRQLCDLLIDDACAVQGVDRSDPHAAIAPQHPQGGASAPRETPMPLADALEHRRSRLLRLLPPPPRWAALLRLVPAPLSARAFALAMTRTLAQPLASGMLDFLHERRLGIRVTDLGLGWVVELRDGQLRVCAADIAAEATVSGSATDLLLLASRLEDADTLFFQRRLQLTGDTELGLTARNVLDRLPWETVPLALRIGLNRAARFAASARSAYRGEVSGLADGLSQ